MKISDPTGERRRDVRSQLTNFILTFRPMVEEAERIFRETENETVLYDDWVEEAARLQALINIEIELSGMLNRINRAKP